MRILIHAGIHRTGSTSLQGFLAANRAGLAAQGIAYPGEGPNHQDFAWAVLRGDAGARQARALAEGAEAAGARLCVLSAEDFAQHRDLGWVRALAERWETSAALYLRRQDDWLNSWYNQHVKWPFDKVKSRLSPFAFLDRIEDFFWIDYDALLDRWAQALGAERLRPAVVEPGQVTDVTADFCALAGIDAEPLAPAPRVNDSLPPHVLEIARHLGLHEMPPGMRRRVNKALVAGLAPMGGRARTVFPPEARLRVLERFEESNAAVARRWFARDRLFLAPPPAPEEPWARMPEMDRERLLRDWVAPVVRELARRA